MELPDGSVFRRAAYDQIHFREKYDEDLDRPFESWYNDVVREGAVGISLACGTFEEFQMKVAEFYLFMEDVYDDLFADQRRNG